MLVRDNAHGFEVVAVLQLAGRFLNLFIRNFEARQRVAHEQRQMIALREVTFVASCKIAGGARVRKIFRHHGIQVPAGHAAVGAHAERVLPPDVLRLRESSAGIKTSAGYNYVSVKSGRNVSLRIHFDHAAHLSSVLGGKSRGVDGHRVHVIGFDFRPEAGRAIVGERNSIHNELRLVLGPARVQDGISLVKPSGLRIHEILERSPR